MQLLRLFAACIILSFTLAHPARAVTLLRDPDIEYALKQLASPVLQAAGLSASRMNILVIDDRSLNAFVIDQDSIFIHSGLLLKMTSPQMLQAVLAHEAAHIANGHLVRRPINFRNARTAASLGLALAAIAGAATGNAQAAAGIAAGSQGTAQRLFFAHNRSEESSADNAAISYMVRAGIDPHGAVEVMDLFRGQEALSAARRDPYASTHPLSADRIRVLQRLAEPYKGRFTPSNTDLYWFARAKGKLSAFQRNPKWTLTRAGESGFADVRAMREAIAYHRQSDLRKSLAAMDRALAARPNDPFYHELRGQILMESRQFAPATAAYARAVNAAPRNALILGSYGRALLTQGDTAKALDVLERARSRDGRDMRVMRDLAAAHAKSGNAGLASVVTAERYALIGRLDDAVIHANRASGLLPRGSGGWQRAQDVLQAAKVAQR
ncbi:M48 family metalloprotease [Roseovarius sp. LXJ103]|uniref:M48 family metalloprotease n=1 Tax=Roseovarius carneus TaxID=2853164 RepID=UPI000D620B48|nr:M48 family metalloprotease [Roseovarius carneus]MBZ8119216.1 M48 family metalloprotease [Roseovarius carneus]PWE35158.1 peptidase M48 [Pelagicola sp. LXJ1103]